jgi:hypothetical protein
MALDMLADHICSFSIMLASSSLAKAQYIEPEYRRLLQLLDKASDAAGSSASRNGVLDKVWAKLPHIPAALIIAPAPTSTKPSDEASSALASFELWQNIVKEFGEQATMTVVQGLVKANFRR